MAVAAELVQTPTYQLVDLIPDVAEARQDRRLAAREILETRRGLLLSGVAETVDLPLQIDAMSTANAVLEAAQTHGEGSPQHTERWQGLVLDCQRLVGEWYRKKKPEHFDKIRHYFDEHTEDFYSHGMSITQMTYNALTPILDNTEEEDRRINEHVENATPQILRGLGQIAIGSQVIRTISECTDKAINAYTADQKAGRSDGNYNGYVPQIDKLVLRDIDPDKKTKDRFEEQVAVPGIFFTHELLQLALERRGAPVGAMDKTALHGAQMLANDRLMEFVAYLDAVASEEWCTEVFMGEEVPRGSTKDYAGFWQEARQREESLKDIAQTVALYVLDLAEEGFDPRKAPAKVEEFVKSLLLNLGKQSYAIAEQMFDKQTAIGLQQVAQLEAQGRYNEAFVLQQAIKEKAPGGGYCGGSACGLEEVNLASKEGKELAEKLKAKPGDKISKDKERSCKKCGGKNVAYAYNSRRVNKHCDDCGAFESKLSPATTQSESK